MKINFKQKRDLNDLVQDTYVFLRENFKPLLILLLNYAGPFLLISAGASALMQRDLNNFISAQGGALTDPIAQLRALTSSSMYWVLIVSNLIAGTIIMGVIYSYISHYISSGIESITPEIILADVKANFILILSTNIVIGLAVFAGLFLFLVGALYIFIILLFTVFIRLYENSSLSQAMSRSIFLVKDNWWATFGTLLVFYALVLLIGYFISLPQIIITALLKINAGSTVVLVLNALTSFITGFLVIVVYIAQVFMYFNLVEKKTFQY